MSTSRLQQQVGNLLSIFLGQHTIRENYRPHWLNGLEIDFYIEELSTAIEVQGRQHLEYVPHFHKDYNGFIEQQKRDTRKGHLCTQNGIVLCNVYTTEGILNIVEKLSKQQIPYIPHRNYKKWYKKTFPAPEMSCKEPSRQERKVISHHIKMIQRLRNFIDRTSVGRDISCYEKGIKNRKNKIRKHLSGLYTPDQTEDFVNKL